jgi:hypothetical protein
MFEIVADPLSPSCMICFLGPEAKYLNGLVLMRFCLARELVRGGLVGQIGGRTVQPRFESRC